MTVVPCALRWSGRITGPAAQGSRGARHRNDRELFTETSRPMNTEEDFLRAILDDVNDALRRLVFADWLEERGDPRAEWLRIDCELGKLRPRDKRRPALEARKQEVWEA